MAYLATKIVFIVVLAILACAFLFFIIHTLRCYLNKPAADDDEDNEFRVRYEQPNNRAPI